MRDRPMPRWLAGLDHPAAAGLLAGLASAVGLFWAAARSGGF